MYFPHALGKNLPMKRKRPNRRRKCIDRKRKRSEGVASENVQPLPSMPSRFLLLYDRGECQGTMQSPWIPLSTGHPRSGKIAGCLSLFTGGMCWVVPDPRTVQGEMVQPESFGVLCQSKKDQLVLFMQYYEQHGILRKVVLHTWATVHKLVQHHIMHH